MGSTTGTTMGTMDPVQRALSAGGLVAADATIPAGEPADIVCARAYRHPGLKDRVVVRLSPEAFGAADDLEMQFLGFGAAEDKGQVARQRRRALGFPGWALVNDPKNNAPLF